MWTKKRLLVATVAVPLIAFASLYLVNHSMALASIRAKQAGLAFPGKRAVVVGATSGIGEGIAVRLAQAQFAVTAVGRNQRDVMEKLNAAAPGLPHKFIPCDAKLLSNVKQCMDQIKAESAVAPLDVLVLSQGIASMNGRVETAEEGLDEKMSLHFYSRMAFLEEALPMLRKAPQGGKVLSILSAGIHSPYAAYATDPELKTAFSLKNAADAAGFYNDCYLDSLSRMPENSNITFVHAAPGGVATRWGSDFPLLLKGIVRGLQYFLKSPEDCAEFMCAPLFNYGASSSSTTTAAAGAGAAGAADAAAEGKKAMSGGGFLLLNEKAEPTSKAAGHDEAREAVYQYNHALITRLLKAKAAAAGQGAAAAGGAGAGAGAELK